MPPDRCLEIEFEMGQPISGLHQRWPATDARIGELHAVARRAELNLLLVTRLRRTARGARLIGRRLRQFRFRQRSDVLHAEAEDADRPGNILYRLLAQIGKGERQLVLNLIVRRPRYADPAGLAEGFQTGGDIDAVAEDVVVVD